MIRDKRFYKSFAGLTLSIALQNLLTYSVNLADNIMIGRYSQDALSGVSLCNQYQFFLQMLVVGVSEGIVVLGTRYWGKKELKPIPSIIGCGLRFGCGMALVLFLIALLFPRQMIGLMTNDAAVAAEALKYLKIICFTYILFAGTNMLASSLRSIGIVKIGYMLAGSTLCINIVLNYILIYGHFGAPALGVRGAAIATVISQFANCLCMLAMLPACGGALCRENAGKTAHTRFQWKQYAVMLLPILICELMWSVGENVYAAIYGHLGTDASAAMTLTTPVQSLVIGALCGLSQAASVIIGKKLGNGENEDAYRSSIKLVKYGFVGSLILSALIVLTRGLYTEIYSVEDSVKIMVQQILVAYAIISPFKIQNMILGGGVLRSGGKTHYIMVIDLVGTWVFGVPLGLLTAFVFHLPIAAVYFILSLEECIRFAITVVVFRRRSWMQQLKA